MKSTPALSPDLVRRLQKALTADVEELYQVLLDPAPEVLRATLRNRLLGEEHLLALLKRRDLPEDLLKTIFQSERSKTSHRLQVALAKNPGTPGQIVLALLPHLYLFELLDLCLLPGPSPDQKVAAERAILLRLPATELGSKLTLARRGTPALVGELLKEGDPKVAAVCLDNPKLREIAVVQYLNGPKATAESISAIARHPRWKSLANIRLTILKNPRTPGIWFTLHLPGLPVAEVRNLLLSNRLSSAQKQLVSAELKRRGLQ